MHGLSPLPTELTVRERALGLGRMEVHLDGRLPVGWCENLTTHLTARGASIDRLVATSDKGRWEVEIALLGGVGVEIRRGLYEREEVDARLYELHLSGGDIWPERDGAIGLELRGPDRRGLLAAILRRLGMHGLFPIRMDVQTHGEQVLDRFVLRGYSGSAPSMDKAAIVLAELLEHHPRRLTPRPVLR